LKILGIIFAVLAIIVGLRMVIIAILTAFTGRVLVRTGMKSRWQQAPTMNDAWRFAFRDALMGFLFIILGIALVM